MAARFTLRMGIVWTASARLYLTRNEKVVGSIPTGGSAASTAPHLRRQVRGGSSFKGCEGRGAAMSVARRLRLCSAADRYHEEESDQSENDSSTPHSDLLTAAEERRDQGDKGWN